MGRRKAWDLKGLRFAKYTPEFNLAGEIERLVLTEPEVRRQRPKAVEVDPPTQQEFEVHLKEGRRIVKGYAGIVTDVTKDRFFFTARYADGRYDTGEYMLHAGEPMPRVGEQFIMIGTVPQEKSDEAPICTYGDRLPKAVRCLEAPSRALLEGLVAEGHRLVEGLAGVVTGVSRGRFSFLGVNYEGVYLQGSFENRQFSGQELRKGTRFSLAVIKPEKSASEDVSYVLRAE